MQAYTADVSRLVVLLPQTLTDAAVQPKRTLATDLAAPAGLLAPRAYLAENRRLIEAGGEIRRIFICWAANLATEGYARGLQNLVDNQRAAGVQCGPGRRRPRSTIRLRPTRLTVSDPEPPIWALNPVTSGGRPPLVTGLYGRPASGSRAKLAALACIVWRACRMCA